MKRFDPKLKDMLCEALERFPFFKYAAKMCLISADTFKIMRDEDKDFSARCEASRARGMLKYANNATPDFMLKCADPETFKDRKEVEVDAKIKFEMVSYNDTKDTKNPV